MIMISGTGTNDLPDLITQMEHKQERHISGESMMLGKEASTILNFISQYLAVALTVQRWGGERVELWLRLLSPNERREPIEVDPRSLIPVGWAPLDSQSAFLTRSYDRGPQSSMELLIHSGSMRYARVVGVCGRDMTAAEQTSIEREEEELKRRVA
jgi:hypothetical protein